MLCQFGFYLGLVLRWKPVELINNSVEWIHCWHNVWLFSSHVISSSINHLFTKNKYISRGITFINVHCAYWLYFVQNYLALNIFSLYVVKKKKKNEKFRTVGMSPPPHGITLNAQILCYWYCAAGRKSLLSKSFPYNHPICRKTIQYCTVRTVNVVALW